MGQNFRDKNVQTGKKYFTNKQLLNRFFFFFHDNRLVNSSYLKGWAVRSEGGYRTMGRKKEHFVHESDL